MFKTFVTHYLLKDLVPMICAACLPTPPFLCLVGQCSGSTPALNCDKGVGEFLRGFIEKTLHSPEKLKNSDRI